MRPLLEKSKTFSFKDMQKDEVINFLEWECTRRIGNQDPSLDNIEEVHAIDKVIKILSFSKQHDIQKRNPRGKSDLLSLQKTNRRL